MAGKVPVNLPNHIRRVREKRRLSQARLANLVDTSAQQIDRLEKGERKLTVDWLNRIAEGLSCDPFDLLLQPNVRKESIPLREVPLVSLWRAGQPMTAFDERLPEDERVKVFVPVPESAENVVAAKIEGDSMDKVAPDGSIIIINHDDQKLVNRRYYVIRIDGEVTFKRYRDTPIPRFEPESTNDAHEPIFPTSDTVVIGRVIKVVTDL